MNADLPNVYNNNNNNNMGLNQEIHVFTVA